MLVSLDLPSANGLRETLYAAFTDLDNYALFDDVLPALASLREQGVAAGIVSNFEAWLEDLLVHLEIRNEFPVRVISGLEGMEKPDLEIYALALERLGLPADRRGVRGGQSRVRHRSADGPGDDRSPDRSA